MKGECQSTAVQVEKLRMSQKEAAAERSVMHHGSKY